jgi:hypothetical protein
MTTNTAKVYGAQYTAGWNASVRVGRTGQPSRKFSDGTASHAWEDGYLDHASGRDKWHLRDCPNHDTCGQG